MPINPKSQEKESDFINRCVPILINEGKEQDQAVAICFSIYREKGEGAKSPEPKKESFTVGASRVNDILTNRDRNKLEKLKNPNAITDWLMMSLEFSGLDPADVEDWLKTYKPELGDMKINSMVKNISRVLESRIRERYISLQEQGFYEAFSVGEKPDTDGGKYIVRKGKGRDPENPKKLVTGWYKTKKSGATVNVKQKTGKTKAQIKIAARKAAKTKRQGGQAAKKKAVRKMLKTKRANLQIKR